MLTVLRRLKIVDAVEIRPVGPDDMSDVRYVHATSFRLQAGAYLSDTEIDSFTAHVYSPEYADKIVREDLHAAWLGPEIVGTGGWESSQDGSETARIRSIFVRPLFTGLGIGQLLVAAAETRARKAGFSEFSMRATVNSVSFFELLGYKVTSHGIRMLRAEHDLPVRFMRKDSGDEKQLDGRLGSDASVKENGARVSLARAINARSAVAVKAGATTTTSRKETGDEATSPPN